MKIQCCVGLVGAAQFRFGGCNTKRLQRSGRELLDSEYRVLELNKEMLWNDDLVGSLPNLFVLHHIWLHLKHDINHSNGVDEQSFVVMLLPLNVNKG